MAKSTVKFVCNSCGSVQSRWAGKCPDCGEWNTMDEYRPPVGGDSDAQRGIALEAGAAPEATPIGEIKDAAYDRLPTSVAEFDRVLGGTNGCSGVVPGSTVLLGGDPGIGKSTLLLQAANSLAEQGQRVLYVTSEESPQQTRIRAERLGVTSDELFVLADTNIARITEQVRRVEPAVVVIDSIQMIYKGDLAAAPGSVTQLRSCCTELVYLAKSTGVAVFMVGHVTKEGQLAGPRMLEHLVDTVLYFEGDRYHSHRIVRAVKNRFGSTLEVGLFEMGDSGMREVRDGSNTLAAEYRPMSGSVVCPALQGSRCLLVEIQALTASGFPGSAKRKTTGIDSSRLAMLIAVLEKRAELRLADQDIFVSSIGGMKIIEPAADLAIALAITGAHYNRQLESGTCAFGEVGLGGELRHVQGITQRIAEATRLGFKRVIGPKIKPSEAKGADYISVENMDQAIALLG